MLTAVVCGLLCGNRGYTALVEWLHDRWLPQSVWIDAGYMTEVVYRFCREVKAPFLRDRVELPRGGVHRHGNVHVRHGRGALLFLQRPDGLPQLPTMRDPFDSWVKFSHRTAAVCNDCHLAPGPWQYESYLRTNVEAFAAEVANERGGRVQMPGTGSTTAPFPS